jgi:DNA-binding GntR family transcriptional regulator
MRKLKIADMIGKDLRKRMQQGNPGFQPVTLQSIANYYNVSITPVKEVVSRLLEEGLLVKNPNGRLTYTAKTTGDGSQILGENNGEEYSHAEGRDSGLEVPLVTSQMESLCNKIRDWVVLATLSGHSHDINEQSLAIRYGINRSRLRQVLAQISQESWIIYTPNRGWQVRPLEDKDVEDYLEIREMMEIKALELCEGRFDHHKVREIIKNNTNSPGTDKPTLDDSLHQYFSELSNNTYIKNFFKVNSKYYSALFNLATLEAATVRVMAEQHCDILQAILKNDWSTAKKSLRLHIRSQEENLHLAIEKIKLQTKEKR